MQATPILSPDSDRGRVAVVTGAGKSLGAAFAYALGARGFKLVVNNRKRAGEPSSADETVRKLKESGVEAVAEYSDVAECGAAEALVGKAMDTYGRLDAIVCNAGIVGDTAWFGKVGLDGFRSVMEINFFANVSLSLAALAHLKESGAGRLVFVSSAAGLYGARGLAPYAATKGALTSFALTLSDELKRYGVCVNVLTPFALSQMTAADIGADGTMALPEETAPAVAWMASADCAVTGQIWVAAGWRYRRALTVETIGGRSEGGPEWLAANAESLSDMTGAKTFRGGQEAFQDIFAEIVADHRRRKV
ncbi:MAG: SDR family NAD(P)-dependent oxidoreductase [Amphiplicatus sp.]